MSTPAVNRMAESIAKERDASVPDVDLLLVGRVRRRLFQGETLTPKIVVTEIGGSNGLLGQVMFQLETLGYGAIREHNEEGLTTYRLANPDHEPTEADYTRLRELTSTRPSAQKRAKSRKKVKATNTSSSSAAVARTAATVSPPPRSAIDVPDLPPLPDIGQPLMVYALALNEDGSISLGLRNGSRQWLTNVVGQSER